MDNEGYILRSIVKYSIFLVAWIFFMIKGWPILLGLTPNTDQVVRIILYIIYAILLILILELAMFFIFVIFALMHDLFIYLPLKLLSKIFTAKQND